MRPSTDCPAVYSPGTFTKDGGLISYGPDPVGIYRQSASYVDRIVKGEKPADLPVCTENLNPGVMVMKSTEDQV